MRNETVGFAMCGSYCTFEEAFGALETLKLTFPKLVPILSENAAATDSRFGTAEEHRKRLETICGVAPVTTIREAEKFGPANPLDLLIIAPCTGNTLAKLANGITDTAVTMAVKSHLRSGKPVVIAFGSNDGLSASAKNLGELLNRKHYYFVPMYQDAPESKPRSLAADYDSLEATILAAAEGRQVQPILRG